MFDMGPYYVTALINLMGEVKEVSGMTGISYPQRTITSEKKYGQKVNVEAPTYVMGNMRFANGAIGSLFTTFDVNLAEYHKLEIYGTEGTIYVPDPNGFGGDIKLLRSRTWETVSMPLLYHYTDNCRGLGLADMAKAIQTGRNHRANSMQQLHVVEVMSAFYTSARTGRRVEIESRYQREKLMPRGEMVGVLDD
jgi:predicted dehydrogenase